MSSNFKNYYRQKAFKKKSSMLIFGQKQIEIMKFWALYISIIFL
jgi:hypothetical protein